MCIGERTAATQWVKDVDESQKPLQLNLGRWSGHRSNRLHLGRKWDNVSGVHDVTQVFDLGSRKEALLSVDAQTSFVKKAKNFPNICQVLVQRMTGHEDILSRYTNTRSISPKIPFIKH